MVDVLHQVNLSNPSLGFRQLPGLERASFLEGAHVGIERAGFMSLAKSQQPLTKFAEGFLTAAAIPARCKDLGQSDPLLVELAFDPPRIKNQGPAPRH